MTFSPRADGKYAADEAPAAQPEKQHSPDRQQPSHQHATPPQNLVDRNRISSEPLPQSPSATPFNLLRAPSYLNSSATGPAQSHDVYHLLENYSSSPSSDSDPDNLSDNISASFMRVGNAGAALTAAGQGASSIMRAIDALKHGSRQRATVKLHTRTPEAGNGLPFAGLIDAATGTFKFAPGTSSSHFVRNSPSDAINAQLPRLYAFSAPEMHIKRFWDPKKGRWCQRWSPTASERQSPFTENSRKKSVSFVVNTNLSPSDSDAFSGSGSKYRYVDSASSDAINSSSSSKRHNEEPVPPTESSSTSAFHSGISFLGHDAQSMAASATAPHMWRAWGAAAVRVHAQHAVSASCLYREIRAHAETLDEALHHLAESCSVWHHGYTVLQARCASTSLQLYIFRALRVMFNLWKKAVNVRTFTLRTARQRALQLPRIKQLFQYWRLVCLSSRVRHSVAGMFNTRFTPCSISNVAQFNPVCAG